MGIGYDIIESDFNKKLSSAYQLSILAGMDSLVYFVFDVATGNALVFRTVAYTARPTDKLELTKELDAIFAREELLSYLYRRVKIILPTQTSVLVPARLYNELEKSTYFRELTDKEPTLQILTDHLDETGALVVYPADTTLMTKVKKQFPTGRFYCQTTPLLLGFSRMMLELGDVSCFFAHFSDSTLHLALFEKQYLQFYNTFACASASDVLYYTLLAYNQFNLDPSRIPLRLSGQILEDSDIFRMLCRYIASIRFAEEPKFLKFSRKYSDVAAHFYLDVYSLALCK